MPFDVLIPARLASTRLPGKPLADIAGLPMIVRVARRAAQSAARSVTVAADDASIVAACTATGSPKQRGCSASPARRSSSTSRATSR